MQLTQDPSRADLMVDLSNVCSRDVLGGSTVSLERLRTAVAIFEEWCGLQNAHVFAVADNSLFSRLASRTDRHELRRLVDGGLVEALPGADERLLELVELTGGILMTWDRFEGHRDNYPWLQGDASHFVLIHEVEGRLIVGLRDMGTVSGRRVSERAEIDSLKAARLLDTFGRPDTTVLMRWWVCPHRTCTLFTSAHEQGQPIPLRERGAPVCSLHRLPLTDDGPRAPQAQFKITVDGRVRSRFLVSEGAPPVVIGRGLTADVDLTDALGQERVELVSRRHAEVWMSSGVLHVRDQGSSNGTRILGGQAILASPGQDHALHVEQKLLLAEVVTLEVSGRRFPSLDQRRAPRAGAPDPGVTRLG